MRLNSVPPHALVMSAVVAIQLGAVLSIKLFPIIGTEGTIAVRIIFSAIILLAISASSIASFSQLFKRNWALLLCFGFCLAAMYFCFYQAIARIPLGAAVAIEFSGPLGIAAITSKRLSHFILVGLAILGIVLLSPLGGASLDGLGVIFALLAGAAWAAFIILTKRVGERVPGNAGLAIGMIVAALAMIPFFVPVSSTVMTNPSVIALGLGVALLATAIPFTFEFEALKRLSARTYGVLVSVEPAVATMIGALLLGERLGMQGMLAVACVVIAAIGITVSDAENSENN